MLRQYMKGPECPSNCRIDGKTVIITGANSGIGKATALELANRGATVILGCRCLGKGEAAATEIKNLSGNANVSAMKLDLASLDSVRKFVENFKAKEISLDVLINNAGVMLCPFKKTEDGIEEHLSVNYLGHFLLTLLLLDKLRAAPEARIINVSAVAHYVATIQLEDINLETNYVPREAYGQSKLAQVMFTRELAKRLEGTKITVNSLHPGIVRGTGLVKYTPLNRLWVRFVTFPVTWLLLKTPKDGAQTTVFLATSAEVEGISGKYFSDCQLRTPSELVLDTEKLHRLWTVSTELVGLPAELTEK